MTLLRARTTYVRADQLVNDIWKAISVEFLKHLDKQAQRANLDDTIYVPTTGGTGVEKADISAFLSGDFRGPLLLSGKAGVGKTSFLNHVFGGQTITRDWVLSHVDLLNEPRGCTPDRIRTRVCELSIRINQDLIEKLDVAGAWPEYALANSALIEDRRLLTTALRSSPTDAGVLLAVRAALNETRIREPESWIRLQSAFISHTGSAPHVLVIDNIDQLTPATVTEIVDIAVALAASEQFAAGAKSNIRVIFAARDTTTSLTIRPSPAYGMLMRGRVQPPVLADALKRRLDAYLRDPHAQRERENRIAQLRRSAQQSRFFDHSELDSNEAVVSALCKMIEGLIGDIGSSKSSLSALLYSLCNQNVRECLFAVAGYVASGHHDLEVLHYAIKGHGKRPSERKLMRALLLGTSSIYNPTTNPPSWLLNLLSDGGSDDIATLIRLRLLKLVQRIAGDQGVGRREAVELLFELFGYPQSRSESCWEIYVQKGLLEETTDERYVLGEAGRAYLSSMMRRFEYLQHIAVDVAVPSHYYTSCQSHTEQPYLRFLRVLKIAAYIRDLEKRDIDRLTSTNNLSTYRQIFRDDLVCTTVGQVLKENAVRLASAERRDMQDMDKRMSRDADEFIRSCDPLVALVSDSP